MIDSEDRAWKPDASWNYKKNLVKGQEVGLINVDGDEVECNFICSGDECYCRMKMLQYERKAEAFEQDDWFKKSPQLKPSVLCQDDAVECPCQLLQSVFTMHEASMLKVLKLYKKN